MIAMRQFFRNFGEIRKLMRRKSNSKDVIRVCPICLESSLAIEPTFLTFIVPSTYSCSNCQYKGPIFAEVPIEDYETILNEKSEISDNELVNVDNF